MAAPHPSDAPLPVTAQPTLRLHGPDELVASVPHLIGFVPQDSMVVVALRRPRGGPARMAATLRVDLAEDPVPHAVPFLHSVRRHRARDVVVLLYDRGSWGTRLRDELVDDLRTQADEAELELTDVLRVEQRADGWQFWSLLCTNPRCCPPAGRHVRADAPVVAEAVGRGLVALPSRQDVAAELSIDSGRLLEVGAALRGRRVGRSEPWRRREVAWADTVLGAQPGLPVLAGDAARLLTALRDVRVRDALLVCPGASPARVRQVWSDLVRCAPQRVRAAPATLLAASYLAEGGGVRATLALEEALRCDPGYTLAGLLHQAVVTAVPPSELGSLLATAAEVERGLRPMPVASPTGPGAA